MESSIPTILPPGPFPDNNEALGVGQGIPDFFESGLDVVGQCLAGDVHCLGGALFLHASVKHHAHSHIRATGKRTNLVDSRVDEHSMKPMLHPGNIIAIDRDDKIIVKNKMFAIYMREV